MSKKKHYVNNSSFRLEILKSIEDKKLTAQAIEMYTKIVENIQHPFKYKFDSDREDCRSTAVEVFLLNWHKYDIARSNTFAFFTRMAYNGIYAGWRELSKNREEFSYSNIFQEKI